MSLPNISQACREATRLCLAAGNGLNALVQANATAFGAQPFAFDFAKGSSLQYFGSYVHADDLEESTPSKYPLLIHYSVNSINNHEQMGAGFSGPVVQVLTFYLTDPSLKISSNLENAGDLLEAAINSLFANGNWPQDFGANAVCGVIPMVRGPVDDDGQAQRQAFTFKLVFDQVSN